MRENVAERFWREVRVDRIWEGTSEIQRNIVADQLAKRGVLRPALADLTEPHPGSFHAVLRTRYHGSFTTEMAARPPPMHTGPSDPVLPGLLREAGTARGVWSTSSVGTRGTRTTTDTRSEPAGHRPFTDG